MKEESRKATFYTHASVKDGARMIAKRLRECTEAHARVPTGFLFDDEPHSMSESSGMANYRITVEKVEDAE